MLLRTAIRGALLIVVAVAGLSYLSYLRTGSYWIPGFVSTSMQGLGVQQASMGPATLDQPAYKWLDKGKWVYGDHPPPGVEAIAIHETPE